MSELRNRRVTDENPVPRIWRIPIEIRRRLSSRGGRQRAIISEDHLLLVLHSVPSRQSPRQPRVYFWRSPSGEWSHSEQGSGFAALEHFVQGYENRVVELEEDYENAESTTQLFAILEEIGPIHRAARSLHDTLTQAKNETKQPEQRQELQSLCDQGSDIDRSAEILQHDVQNAIQYRMARQAEVHSGFSRAQSLAAHRLNILVAIFLPSATLSSIFGMNLNSGLEAHTPLLFWSLLLIGAVSGAAIMVFVMKVRGLSPDEW